MLDERVSAIIGDIYAGALDSPTWNAAVRSIMELAGARFVLVATVDARSHTYYGHQVHGPDDRRFLEGLREYEQELYLSDPTIRFMAHNPRAGLFDSRRLGSDDELRAHPYLRWQESRLGTFHSMAAYTQPEDELTFGMAIHPPVEQGPLTARNEKLFRMLFGHMNRAVRLVARPPDFDHPTEARLLIDRRGVVRMISHGADAVLASEDGISIVSGRLQAARPRDTARIEAAIVSALGAVSHGGTGGGVTVPRLSGKRDWLVLVSPLPDQHEPFAAHGPAVLVRIVDTERGPAPGSGEVWRRLFGLTPAEVRLMQSLISTDGDLRAAAEQLGMRYSTARVHLRHIYDKTGARGQAPLLRLLQRLER